MTTRPAPLRRGRRSPADKTPGEIGRGAVQGMVEHRGGARRRAPGEDRVAGDGRRHGMGSDTAGRLVDAQPLVDGSTAQAQDGKTEVQDGEAEVQDDATKAQDMIDNEGVIVAALNKGLNENVTAGVVAKDPGRARSAVERGGGIEKKLTTVILDETKMENVTTAPRRMHGDVLLGNGTIRRQTTHSGYCLLCIYCNLGLFAFLTVQRCDNCFGFTRSRLRRQVQIVCLMSTSLDQMYDEGVIDF